MKLLLFIVGLCFVEAAVIYNPGAYFESRTIIIPHDDKIKRGGEDSAHVCDTLITVADGVGGWARHGVNPGLFSKLLTRGIKDLHIQEPNLSTRDLTIESHKIAAKAYQGSATSVTIKIENQSTISTTNIGDSGYALYHIVENQPVQYFKSVEQQKSFNFPYQIGSRGDDPKTVGLDLTHTVLHGDIILVYSDGVSDNLYDAAYLTCFQGMIGTDGILQSYGLVADCIARKAYQLGKDKSFFSPFAKGAADSGKKYIGGKHDDITITVAQIFQTDSGRIQPKEEIFTNLISVYTSPPSVSESISQQKQKLNRWDEL